MKNILAVILLFLLPLLRVCAQSAPLGIYLSASDFLNHKLSYTPIAGEKHRIKLHNEFYKPYIALESGKQAIVLRKDSVFGYCLRDSTSFRFYGKEAFAVLNAGTYPLLYQQSYMPGGKGARPVIECYFSRNETSPILRLTRANLSTAYSNAPSFLEQVYDTFQSDEELIQYNSYGKNYRLVGLFQKQQVVRQ